MLVRYPTTHIGHLLIERALLDRPLGYKCLNLRATALVDALPFSLAGLREATWELYFQWYVYF